MKKTVFLLAACLSALASSAQEPTPLYAGVRYNNDLVEIDTTGATFTIVSTTDMTSGFGTVDGTFGLALHPLTDEMYILYETGSECDRRLGIVDLETGTIADIGNAGNLVDIDFGPDGTLYATTGASCAPDYTFVEVNTVTAATTDLFDHISSIYGSTIGYNPFADEMVHISRSDISSIDLGTLVETDGSPSGHPGEAHALVFLREDLAWMMNYGELHTFNPLTEAFVYVDDMPDDYHALTFGPPACTPMELLLTGTDVCEGTEVTLDAEGMGDIITWDGGISDGIPFLPGPPGTYTYTATSEDENDCPLVVEVEVFGLPTVIAGSGDEEYCDGESIVLSAAGDADEYSWDPLDFTPGVGTHTYTLTGTYDAGCENTSTVDIVVHPLPDITANVDDDVICIGGEVVFTGGGGETYVWETEGVEDGEAFEPTETGTMTYTVYGTDINGCENSASVEVEVLEQIEITGTTTDEVAGDDGAINISFTGGAPSYTVDWDNDETGDFDDPADIGGLAGGTYTVIVRGSEGCEGTATFTVNSQLTISEAQLVDLHVFPNPTIADVTIQWVGQFDYQLVSASGAILQNGTAFEIRTLSMESLAAGIYYIRLKTQDTSTSVKVVKK